MLGASIRLVVTRSFGVAPPPAAPRLEAPFPPIEVLRWRCKLRDETTGRPLLDDRGREMFEQEDGPPAAGGPGPAVQGGPPEHASGSANSTHYAYEPLRLCLPQRSVAEGVCPRGSP